jgi:hypothetical protein
MVSPTEIHRRKAPPIHATIHVMLHVAAKGRFQKVECPHILRNSTAAGTPQPLLLGPLYTIFSGAWEIYVE